MHCTFDCIEEPVTNFNIIITTNLLFNYCNEDCYYASIMAIYCINAKLNQSSFYVNSIFIS